MHPRTPDPLTELAWRIHDAPQQLVLAVTGGGSGAIAALLQTPGASRTVLEATVPYSSSSLIEWLGGPPEQYCSEQTARRMAMAAYIRAQQLVDTAAAAPLVGIACTASLASDRPKQGAHRIHIAAQTAEQTLVMSLELKKGGRTRQQEEQVATTLIMNTIADVCGITEQVGWGRMEGELVSQCRALAPKPWQQLLAGETQLVPLGQVPAAATGPTLHGEARSLIFPGAFNPLHQGHQRMAAIASARYNRPVEFEISVQNVDKPPLDFLELERRTEPFAGLGNVWLTRAATFVEKGTLFPAAVFVVGADTIVRIADPRYYGNHADACRRAIAQLAEQGCTFLVFGRQIRAGFQTLDDLPLPEELRRLCTGIPASEFREDISSTSLRDH